MKYRFDGNGVLTSYKYRHVWIEQLDERGEPTEKYFNVPIGEYRSMKLRGEID